MGPDSLSYVGWQAVSVLLQVQDPEPLNHVDWRATSLILRWMWMILIFAFFFAAHMLLAHAIIPSLLDSGHVPDGLRERARKLRLPLYVMSFLLLACAAYFITIMVNSSQELHQFWPRSLI
jgi:hypothetical protein